MTVTDVRHDYSRAHRALTTTLRADEVEELFRPLQRSASDALERDGFGDHQIEIARYVDVRYPNQVHELSIELPRGSSGSDPVRIIEETFHDKHEQQFAYAIRTLPVEIIHWRVAGFGSTAAERAAPAPPGDGVDGGTTVPKSERPVYFDSGGFQETPLYQGDALGAGTVIAGPAVVESENTTVVVFPGQTLRARPGGSYLLEAHRNTTTRSVVPSAPA